MAMVETMNTDIVFYEEQESWWSRFWARRRAKKAIKKIRKNMLALESQWVRFESYMKLYEEHQTFESYLKLSKHWESMVEQASNIIALCKMHVISVPLTADIAASSVLPKENPGFRSTVDAPLGYRVRFENVKHIADYKRLVDVLHRVEKHASLIVKSFNVTYWREEHVKALNDVSRAQINVVEYETKYGEIILD